jgi:hypothetical protein
MAGPFSCLNGSGRVQTKACRLWVLLPPAPAARGSMKYG